MDMYDASSPVSISIVPIGVIDVVECVARVDIDGELLAGGHSARQRHTDVVHPPGQDAQIARVPGIRRAPAALTAQEEADRGREGHRRHLVWLWHTRIMDGHAHLIAGGQRAGGDLGNDGLVGQSVPVVRGVTDTSTSTRLHPTQTCWRRQGSPVELINGSPPLEEEAVAGDRRRRPIVCTRVMSKLSPT